MDAVAGAADAQPDSSTTRRSSAAGKVKKRPWPKTLSEQAAAVQGALASLAAPADEKAVAACFSRAKKERVAELLETLESLERARRTDDGRYVAA